MARSLPRTRFHSSGFIRLLADFAAADSADSRQSFADRLGQWLDYKDAIALFSVLHGNPASAAPPQATGAGEAVQKEFVRVRAALVDSIVADGVLNPGKVRIKLPAPAWHPSDDGAADFAPYQRYYLAHQRDMNASIGPLRASVRAALATSSPALRRLAALDAALDQALGARERSLLATVPQLLARRFEQLHRAHTLARGDGQAPDDPAQWMQPGGWLAAFCKDMQAVLLAELDLRLEPVAGLMEALGNEVNSNDEQQ